jgi:hypothetical protein
MRTITELKQHCKAVGNSFFSAGNARYFGSSRVFGIYRAPYTPDTEGYVIAETIFTASNGVSEAPEYVVYRFQAAPSDVEWQKVGRHASKTDAVAFLKSQGAVKS